MMPGAAGSSVDSRIHLPSLMVAVVIMVACTLYPPMMTDARGKADHWLAAALFLAMSAGFVRGVGFIPQAPVWRCLFSGWSCTASLALACVLAMLNA
jgi:predicted membrane protein